MDNNQVDAPVKLPRVAITYCTQCRWMLRAAYFGQELLSTFGTSIGEIALIPATGGLFTVHLTYAPLNSDESAKREVLIWDRKAEGGFPETKILKQKIRNHIDPEKALGHSDTPVSKTKAANQVEAEVPKNQLTQGQQSSKTLVETAESTTGNPSADCADCK